MKNIPENLRALEEKIDQLREKEHGPVHPDKTAPYSDAARIGFRITVELISGVLVGAGFGHLLDWLFKTQPLFMVIFLLLGGAAGFLNVYRMVKEEETKNSAKEEE